MRIVAASNRPLKALAAAGKFRQDLYFRLRGFELEVPPLRERPDDIPALAEFFAAKHRDAIGRKVLGISAGALGKLTAYDFPGNVRELENEIRRMVALAKDGDYLTTESMSPAILAAAPRAPRRANGFTPEGATLKEKVESLERQLVGEVLLRHRWNQSRAANEFGLVTRRPRQQDQALRPQRDGLKRSPMPGSDDDNERDAPVVRFPQSRVRLAGSE